MHLLGEGEGICQDMGHHGYVYVPRNVISLQSLNNPNNLII